MKSLRNVRILASALLLIGLSGASAPAKTFDENVDAASEAYDSGEYKTALKYYKAAAKEDAEDAQIWFNIGVCQELLGMADEAIESYRKYLDLNPKAKDKKDVEEWIAALEGEATQDSKTKAGTAPMKTGAKGRADRQGKNKIEFALQLVDPQGEDAEIDSRLSWRGGYRFNISDNGFVRLSGKHDKWDGAGLSTGADFDVYFVRLDCARNRDDSGEQYWLAGLGIAKKHVQLFGLHAESSTEPTLTLGYGMNFGDNLFAELEYTHIFTSEVVNSQVLKGEGALSVGYSY